MEKYKAMKLDQIGSWSEIKLEIIKKYPVCIQAYDNDKKNKGEGSFSPGITIYGSFSPLARRYGY